MCVKTEVDEPTFQDLLREFMEEPSDTGGDAPASSEVEGDEKTIV